MMEPGTAVAVGGGGFDSVAGEMMRGHRRKKKKRSDEFGRQWSLGVGGEEAGLLLWRRRGGRVCGRRGLLLRWRRIVAVVRVGVR